MKNTRINLGVIQKVAKALGELNDRVVYVGGAIVSLYINDPAAEDIRPTKDIDISLEILTLGDLEKLRIQLTMKGVYQTSNETVMCRFMYDDVTVDVMSTHAVGWLRLISGLHRDLNMSRQLKLKTSKSGFFP